MRLLFDLSPADEAAFEDARGADEKVLYCLPFDCRHDKRVDGRMVFTDKAIYKVIDAEVEARWDFSELSDFFLVVLCVKPFFELFYTDEVTAELLRNRVGNMHLV